MSIAAGRTFLAIAGVLLVAAASWWVLAGAASGVLGPGTVVPAALCCVAVVALCVGAPLCARFVEAEVADDRSAPGPVVVIRSVLRGRRILPLADIETVVVLAGFSLPARAAAGSAPRVVIRPRGGGSIACTPRDVGFVGGLRAHGLPVIVDDAPLTPAQAARRYPGSAIAVELVAGVLPWAAIAIGSAVILWVVVEAFGG